MTEINSGKTVAWAYTIIPQEEGHEEQEKVSFKHPSETWETYDGFAVENVRRLEEVTDTNTHSYQEN